MKVLNSFINIVKEILPEVSAVAGFGFFAGNLIVSSDTFQKKWLKSKLVQSKISNPSAQFKVDILVFMVLLEFQSHAYCPVEASFYRTRERLEAACQCVTKDS
jgi:hypothetical protein